MKLFFILSDIHEIVCVLPEPAVTPSCPYMVCVRNMRPLVNTHARVLHAPHPELCGCERNWGIRMHIRACVYINIHFHPVCGVFRLADLRFTPAGGPYLLKGGGGAIAMQRQPFRMCRAGLIKDVELRCSAGPLQR